MCLCITSFWCRGTGIQRNCCLGNEIKTQQSELVLPPSRGAVTIYLDHLLTAPSQNNLGSIYLFLIHKEDVLIVLQ